MLTFQELILELQSYWGGKGCALLQPYDMEMGAGTFHTATFLRAIGPEPWKAAYVQPSRRPKDGRYGDNPNRLQHYYQYQVVLKPSPDDLQDLYLGSLKALGVDPRKNDIRFVEDDWESPTLGAWGLGWEVWLNGMEVTQFTYFQQIGGLDCKPVLGELTYGLERLAMYLQRKESIFDLVWVDGVTYGDVYHQNEVEQSKYNFEASDADWLLSQFNDYESQAKRLIETGLPLPGYEMVMKCSHAFNLLDARGAISVTERAAYIGRVRALAKLVAQAYFDSREKLGFPMLKRPQLPTRKVRAWAMSKTKAGKAPVSETLLVELLTEELPPKGLNVLSEAFGSALAYEFTLSGFLPHNEGVRTYATPRRIAVQIPRTLARSPDVERDIPGPSTNAPVEAVAGFARKNGVPVDKLIRRATQKGEVFVARKPVKGSSLEEVLAGKVETALKTLSFPRAMRWGDGEVQFARPVHGLVMMHGKRVIPGTVLGVPAGNTTMGHRFMGAGSIRLSHADEYEAKLRKDCHVVADFATRKEEIDRQLRTEAKRQKASLGEYQDLLDEVAALVEFPAVYAGAFDASFLEMPQECLILTMRQNQKYFPLFASDGKLLPKFLIVSNMRVDDPRPIVGGNERVVRPRLEDARFFLNQDRKIRLEARVPQLAKVVFHNKLGSQLERMQRIKLLAGGIARSLRADVMQAERAAELSKADLLTGMVGEFPELQGVMGRYYALHDGEPREVADAIEEHYRPRFAGDKLPEGSIACAVALADKLDALAGLFSIGEQPTGDKDPFGLRRAALGVIRIVVENQLSLSLWDLVNAAFEPFKGKAQTDLQMFLTERMRSYFQERGYSANEVEAVLSVSQAAISLIPKQLEAVRAFSALPEAASLAAANKRIANILRQAEGKGESFADADVSALKEAAEIALFEALQAASRSAKPLFDAGDFAGYLKTFASLKSPVDSFFDTVMVMADDKKLRENRLALLTDMRKAMNRFSDISKLAA